VSLFNVDIGAGKAEAEISSVYYIAFIALAVLVSLMSIYHDQVSSDIVGTAVEICKMALTDV
jgi:hypothetical protein